MVPFLQSLFFQLRHRFSGTEGQDLIEYALLAALVSLGAAAGVQSIATDISTTFTYLATTFNAQV